MTAKAEKLNTRRILMSADTIGGVWTYAIELARSFKAHNVEVILATMGGSLSRDQRRSLKGLRHVDVHESNYRLEWMESPWSDVARGGQWLLELEQLLEPDIIHLNSFAHGALPFKSPKLVVGHSCVCSWWNAVKKANAPAEWDSYREVVRAGLQAAHLVVAPSWAMLECLQQHYGPLHGKVIYNGRDPSLFKPGRKEEIILSAGRLWDEAKNLSALALVAPEVPWPIYVAGEAKHPNGTIVRNQHLCFLGKLPAEMLSGWYSRAGIYALPARYEPFGLSVLEAGLSGCALVLGNIPSQREIWGGAAMFVDASDPDELKFTLRFLAQNLFRRKELAAFAQCRAIQFSPQRMAEGYLAAYSELLSDRLRPAPFSMTEPHFPEVLCAS